MELSGPKIKKGFSYISGNGIFKKISELKKLKESTPKKIIIFHEMEFSSYKFKKLYFFENFFLYFRKELAKTEKQKFLTFQDD